MIVSRIGNLEISRSINESCTAVMDNHESHINKSEGESDEGDLQSVCPCCFNLDALLADADGNDDVRIDQSELVVTIRRDDKQMRDTADGGCESCRFMLKAME